MTERHDPHPADAVVGDTGKPDDSHPGAAEATAHGSADAGGHGDEHGHGGEALGPFDVRMWGAAALGVALGLVVVLAFVQALS